MKKILFIFTVLLSCKTLFIKWTPIIGGVIYANEVKSQGYSTQGNPSDFSWSLFETNSPTSGYGNRRNVIQMSSSWHYHMNVRKIFLDTIMKQNEDMLNAKTVWIDSLTGEMHVSSLAKWPVGGGGGNTYSAGYGLTKYGLEPTASFSVNTSDIMTVSRGIDSMDIMKIAISHKLNSVDTTWMHNEIISKLPTSTYSWTTLPGRPTNLNQFTNGPGYITGFTELDPTVSAASKAITAGNVSDWNTAFSWGNHASAGYITPSSTSALTNKSGNISMWTNNVGYISSYTETDPLFNMNFLSRTTDDLAEGAIKLYYNDSRARAAFSSGTGISISSGVITNTSPNVIQNLSLNSNTLSISGGNSVNLPVPTFTAISAGSGISITSNSIVTNTAPDQVVVLTGTNGITTSGTYPNFTINQKRQETYSGTSNASGLYTITFGTAYSAAPNIQANIINGADNQNIRITAISTTGFTVLVRTRVDVIGLLPTWNNASGLGVDVIVTEK